MKIRLGSLAIILSLGAFALAQSAPRETVTANLNGKKVSVEYGRPSLKGRSFEELIKGLPADRMWRAGSEQVTTLTTEADVIIGGKKLSAGKYSLYIHCPEDGNYSLAVNSNLGQPLGKIWAAAPENLKNEPWPHFSYQKEIGDKEVARVPLKKGTASGVDLFTFAFNENGDGAALTISWGDQSWSVDISAAQSQ